MQGTLLHFAICLAANQILMSCPPVDLSRCPELSSHVNGVQIAKDGSPSSTLEEVGAQRQSATGRLGDSAMAGFGSPVSTPVLTAPQGTALLFLC